MTHLLSLSTALPPARFTTADLLATTRARFSAELIGTVEGLGIRDRYSCIANYPDYLAGEPMRMTVSATDLAASAASSCLARWAGDPRRVGLLVAATNTPSRPLPALGSELMARMPGELSRAASVVCMQAQGCSVLLKAVEVASWYLAAQPDKLVLLVVSEGNTPYLAPLMQEHYQGYRELARLHKENGLAHTGLEQRRRHTTLAIQTMLFGDGAVALLMGRDEAGACARFGPMAHLTNEDPMDSELLSMDWETGCTGNPRPTYVMRAEVPQRGAHYAVTLVRQLLANPASPASTVNGLSCYLVHSGSRKILDGVFGQLGVLSTASAKVGTSYDTLASYGNLSAVSIGFMLAATATEGRAGSALLVAFGVGFTATAGTVTFE